MHRNVHPNLTKRLKLKPLHLQKFPCQAPAEEDLPHRALAGLFYVQELPNRLVEKEKLKAKGPK